MMDNFVPPEMEDNNYILNPRLRISDGRSTTSTSSSSMQSLNNIPLLRQASDDSELLDLGCSCDDPMTTNLTPPSLNGMSAADYMQPRDRLETQRQPHWTLPLAPRQNPDGCSLSSTTSTTSESIPLLGVKNN